MNPLAQRANLDVKMLMLGAARPLKWSCVSPLAQSATLEVKQLMFGVAVEVDFV